MPFTFSNEIIPAQRSFVKTVTSNEVDIIHNSLCEQLEHNRVKSQPSVPATTA